MVSSFYLPPVFAAQFNTSYTYELYCLSPATYIGKALPFGRIWYMRGKKRWATTLMVPGDGAYLEIRVNGFTLGVLFVANRVALKLKWYTEE